LPAEVPPGGLAETADRWIDGGQRILQQVRSRTQPIFGMNHFQIPAESSRGAVQLYGHPLSKLCDLRLPEVKKAHGQKPGAIFNFHHECAASSQRYGGGKHLALDHCIALIEGPADGSDSGAVLIAKRKMKKQVFQRADAKL